MSRERQSAFLKQLKTLITIAERLSGDLRYPSGELEIPEVIIDTSEGRRIVIEYFQQIATLKITRIKDGEVEDVVDITDVEIRPTNKPHHLYVKGIMGGQTKSGILTETSLFSPNIFN